jgi:hypothetical protein
MTRILSFFPAPDLIFKALDRTLPGYEPTDDRFMP